MTTMITIGTLNPDGEIHLRRYAEIVIPLLEAANVKVHGRFKGTEALVGSDVPDLVAIMDFPSIAAMKSFLSSEKYLEAVPHRDKAFKKISTFASDPIS